MNSDQGLVKPLIMLNGQEGQFFVRETDANSQAGIVRIHFTDDENNKEEIPFFALVGAKTPLVVPITQSSEKVCDPSNL